MVDNPDKFGQLPSLYSDSPEDVAKVEEVERKTKEEWKNLKEQGTNENGGSGDLGIKPIQLPRGPKPRSK